MLLPIAVARLPGSRLFAGLNTSMTVMRLPPASWTSIQRSVKFDRVKSSGSATAGVVLFFSLDSALTTGGKPGRHGSTNATSAR